MSRHLEVPNFALELVALALIAALILSLTTRPRHWPLATTLTIMIVVLIWFAVADMEFPPRY